MAGPGLSDGCGELRAFHAFFAASFGRKQWRAQRELPSGAAGAGPGAAQRRNLSESVGISARAMQRFLTEARWSDETVIGPVLGPQATRRRVGVRWQRLSQAGQEIGGSGPAVLRHWASQLPGWDVPGLRQPAGPGVGGQAAVSAQELDLRPGPVCCGGCAGGPAELPVKDGVGPGDAGAGPGVGLPQGRVGCRRRRLRDVADLPGGTGGPGDALRAGRSGRHYGLALGPGLDQSGISGVRPPRQTQAAAWAAADHGAAR